MTKNLSARQIIEKFHDDSQKYSFNDKKPKRFESLTAFFSNICASIRFVLSEKENLFFATLQWVAIIAGYFLWVEVLSLIPEELWKSEQNSRSGSLASLIIFIWGFICIGIVAYPLGILTACMNASFLLRFKGQASTISDCLKVVLHHAWTLWTFSWLDGWWTVERIMDRLPKKNDRRSLASKIADEAIYQSWKLSSLCFMPALLSGQNITTACQNSLDIMKRKFVALAKLRLGYSLVCWIIGIASYITIVFIAPFICSHMASKYDMFGFYFYVGFPLIVALAIVMIIFRPLYIISACRIYAAYCRETAKKIELPEPLPKALSSFISFIILVLIALGLFIYRNELGITSLLSEKIN